MDREPGGHVIGCDWARTSDFTVFTVMGLDGIVYEVDRFRGVEYALQRARLQSIIWRYRPVMVLGEENAIGAPLHEQLRREHVDIRRFHTNNESKSRIVQQLALAFERDEIKIPNDPVLIGELQSFEATILPASGLTRYAAPEGGHDDCVISLALAWEARRRSRVYCPTAMEAQHQREFGLSLLLSAGGGW